MFALVKSASGSKPLINTEISGPNGSVGPMDMKKLRSSVKKNPKVREAFFRSTTQRI